MADKTVAIITGASRGIGKAIAVYLSGLGMDLALNYYGSEDEINDTINEVKKNGVEYLVFNSDISKFENAEYLINETHRHFGQIDVLVNNAGITKDNLLMRMSEAEFDSVIAVNLKGTFNCLRHVSRIMMRQRSGSIINIASVSGVTGNMGQANYSASKAGVIGLTKAAAKEMAARGVRVNAVAPGFIETDMTAVLSEKVKEQMLQNIPLSRYGHPEDVAKTVAFLATEQSSYITGQVIIVDGGMVM